MRSTMTVAVIDSSPVSWKWQICLRLAIGSHLLLMLARSIVCPASDETSLNSSAATFCRSCLLLNSSGESFNCDAEGTRSSLAIFVQLSPGLLSHWPLLQ